MIRLSSNDNNKFISGKIVIVKLTLSYLEDNKGLMIDDIVKVGYTNQDTLMGTIVSRHLIEDHETTDQFTIALTIKKNEC